MLTKPPRQAAIRDERRAPHQRPVAPAREIVDRPVNVPVLVSVDTPGTITVIADGGEV